MNNKIQENSTIIENLSTHISIFKWVIGILFPIFFALIFGLSSWGYSQILENQKFIYEIKGDIKVTKKEIQQINLALKEIKELFKELNAQKKHL